MARLTTPLLPAVGSRVGCECGPGQFAADHAGTVTEHVTDRFGTHAVILMDDGTTDTCYSLKTGPGIGWHQLPTKP